MEKTHSRQVNDSNANRNLKKVTTHRLKLGIKFGKEADGGIEAGLACGYEKKQDKCFYQVEPIENTKTITNPIE